MRKTESYGEAVVLMHTHPVTGEVVDMQTIHTSSRSGALLLRALAKHRGSKSKALLETGFSMNTWRKWMSDEKVGQAMRDVIEFYDDFATDRAEENIREQVDKGDVDNSKWLLERLKSDKYSTKTKVDNNITVKVKVQEF